LVAIFVDLRKPARFIPLCSSSPMAVIQELGFFIFTEDVKIMFTGKKK
jgi:hypothetical protein